MSHLPPEDVATALPAGGNMNFENHVAQTLRDLQGQVDNGLRELYRELTKMVKDTVHEELQRQQPNAAPKSRMAATTKQLDDLNAQKDDLAAKNQSLLELTKDQEAKIASLTLDLSKKNRESRKLHDIIIQSGQDDSAISDEDITKEFSALHYSILRVVKRHFAASGAKTKWKQYNGLKADDRDLWLRAMIADQLYLHLFHPNAKLFGLDGEREKHQVELENKLLERKVPEDNITDWRIQTVKVAQLMSLKKRLYRQDRVSDDLCMELKEVRLSSDPEQWRQAKDDMDNLCGKAFNLALSLRGCKARYEWRQELAPSLVPRSDMELIGPFNVHSPSAPLRPVRVLFGTVYKIVEGDPIVLLKGEVLNGCE